MKTLKLFYFFLILSTSTVFSQEENACNFTYEHLNFQLLNVSSGLSHNFVNDISQDSLGFIWVATYDGLNRYDGKNFLQFKKHLETPSAGLANNYVQEIVVLPDRLLLATDAGMNIYNLRTGEFILVDAESGLYNNNVSAIEKLEDGKFLVGTYQGGVQIADDQLNVYSIQQLLDGKTKNLSSDEISSIVVKDSSVWVGTFNNGLIKISLKNKTIKTWQEFTGTKLSSEVINSLYVDSANNLWIGTRKGLQVIKSTGKVLRLTKSNHLKGGLSDDDVLCFREDNSGQMWIGTRNGGLNILNISRFLKEEILQVHWYLPGNDENSVFNRTVSTIFQDSEDNMWLGTPTGVNFVRAGGEKIKLLKHENINKSSLSHNRIGSIAKASGDNIWVGTDGGGLDLLNPKGERIKHFEHQEGNIYSLSNDYLLSIYQQSADSVWVGTYQGGINLLNPETGKSLHYLQGSTSDGSDVRNIFQAKNGVLWVGTNRGGLYWYDPAADAFQYINNLGKIDIRDIAEDKNGILWLATYGSGIIQYDPATGTTENFLKSNLPGLNSDVIFSILVLPDGDILAGSRYGGLLRLDPEIRTIDNYTEINGLSNNTINSLVQQDSIFIWMGSYNGINRYNMETNEILNISSLDNFQEGEFNIGAAGKNRQGLIFFGGNNGLNFFDTRDFDMTNRKYPLVFEGLKVLNKEVKVFPGSDEAILNESLFFQDKIELAYNENTFSIDFAALKYPEAKNLTYAYKLEGYNEFWIDNQTSGSANFTNVPPGDYKFLVRTTSGLGEESHKFLNITIVPPFWKTWPAYILYFILVALLVWLGSRYYSERLKLKNSLLFEKKQRSLEHNINEERFRFFTAFSHELKTPLTLILAPVENLLSKKINKENTKDLVFIHKNAKSLFQSINRLLEFRKAEEGLSQLKKEPVDLPAKLQKWVKNYIPLAKEKNIKMEYSGPMEERVFMVDEEKIEVIINNLLSNAIKYSDKGGEIKLNFSSTSSGFKIEVKDSGSGIKPEDLSNIFEWYYRSDSKTQRSGTGIGLALSKRFSELHGGSIEVNSKKGIGTIFTLKIPLPQSYMKVEIPDEPEEEDTIFQEEKFGEQVAAINADNERQLILLIDDNEDILNFLNSIFKPDYDVIYSTNGVAGIEKAKKYVPDIIISDVMMPEKDGIDLCSELKQQHSTSHIPIILLTAKGNIESITKGYKEGADDYITKPFNPQLLKTRVKNLMDSRRLLKNYFIKDKVAGNSNDKNDLSLIQREKGFLSELNRIIRSHIGKGTDNVEIIAKEIGMSRTSLYRKLKAVTGFSINEYIRNLKIETAADLIKNENYSVSQASYEVGFSNTKYFRKIFKEKFGNNPSEFKK